MSQSKSFAHYFVVQPYGWKVYFFTDPEKWAQFTARKTRTTVKEHRASVADGAEGMTASVAEMQVAFIGVFNKEPGILAHECVHAANAILERAGIKLDYNNDETQAYLVGYIFDQCFPAVIKQWKTA